MEERRISEKESLEIITSMITRTKERYMLGDGNILLLWGYLTVAVSILVWALLAVTRNPAVNWLWFLIWIIGGIITPIIERRKQVQKGMRSYTDKLISRIWATVGYCAITGTALCLGFLLVKGINAWSMMMVFALVIVPYAEIIQGVIINEKSTIWGGALGLFAGIFTVCCIAGNVPLHATWFMPLFIAAFTCMMIIPGHIINHKAKRNR